ncbi:hypothetical protein IWW55_004954 [Coemansia sp. RSA 2706]|nr:hypothetical protein IWW55_004954 [Coemansia sp. RSA 2706]
MIRFTRIELTPYMPSFICTVDEITEAVDAEIELKTIISAQWFEWEAGIIAYLDPGVEYLVWVYQ